MFFVFSVSVWDIFLNRSRLAQPVFELGIRVCIIGNYLRGHFYVPSDWLKNNQSRAAIITSSVPPHVHAFFKLASLLLLWRQRCNTESWLLLKQDTSPCSTHMGTMSSVLILLLLGGGVSFSNSKCWLIIPGIICSWTTRQGIELVAERTS